MGVYVFRDTAPDFTILYKACAAGFTSPTWQGYPAGICVDCDDDGIVDAVDCDDDGIDDAVDNCPDLFNPGQEDADSDHIGDACDNCPDLFNSGQEDADNDGLGNVCDNIFNGSFVIYDNNDVAALAGHTEITGTLSIGSTSDAATLTLSTFENLSGLESLTSVGGNLEILQNGALTSLCHLYNLNVGGDNLYIYNNTSLSMDDAYALETQLRSNGFTGTSVDISDNRGSGMFSCRPYIEDADSDGAVDAFDTDTIYGTIAGDVQEGINVGIYTWSCGTPNPVDTLVTDSEGYYSIGNLVNSRYLVMPEDVDFNFGPELVNVQIPQAVIQSYDFIGTSD